jgi:hypothetical protein
MEERFDDGRKWLRNGGFSGRGGLGILGNGNLDGTPHVDIVMVGIKASTSCPLLPRGGRKGLGQLRIWWISSLSAGAIAVLTSTILPAVRANGCCLGHDGTCHCGQDWKFRDEAKK